MENSGKMTFFQYCRDRRLIIISILLITVAVYAMWAAQDIVTFDAEGLYNESSAVKWHKASIAMGRWGTYYIKKLFGTLIVNPYFSVAVFWVCFPLSAILWLYNIYTWDNRCKRTELEMVVSELIFCLIYLTHPVWAFVFSYRSHLEVMTFAFFLLPLSLLFLSKAMEKRSAVYYFCACAGVVVTFSCYSTFMLMYGVGICMFLYFRTSDVAQSLKDTWRLIRKLVLFTVICVVVYYLTVKITMAHCGIEGLTSYLTDNFKWGTEPFADSFQRLMGHLKEFFLGNKVIYTSLYAWVVLISFGINLAYVIKKRYKWWRVLCLFGVVITPLLLNILTAGDIVIRGQMPFVLALAFLASEVCKEFITATHSIKNEGGWLELKRGVNIIAIAVIGIFVVHQVQYDTRWMYSDVKFMEMDFAELDEIYYTALQNGGEEGDAIVFVGGLSPNLNDSLLTGEVIGFSYFAFTGYYNDSGKIIEAMNAVGYNVVVPTAEQQEKAVELAEDMNAWPSEGSIKVVDHLIIVRLTYPF